MPAGRPRTFDREAALTKAMHVFWEKGYEGTTMADLIKKIGVKAPGVYAAFGNKDNLFNEVVDAYSNLIQRGAIKNLMETDDILVAVTNFLNYSLELFSGTNNPTSCLVMSATINCAPEHTEQYEKLLALRVAYKDSIDKRLVRAKEEGQLGEFADPYEISEFLMTFIHGLALRARDGATREQMSTSCRFALATIKNLIIV